MGWQVPNPNSSFRTFGWRLFICCWSSIGLNIDNASMFGICTVIPRRHQLRYGGFWIWLYLFSASIVFVIFQSLFQQILPDAAAFLFVVSNQDSGFLLHKTLDIGNTCIFLTFSDVSFYFKWFSLYWISYWVEDFIRKKAIFIFIGGLFSGEIAFF